MSTSEGDGPVSPARPGYDDLEAEERADQLEAALLRHHHLAVLGSLVPRVAHDLRNELMVIEGNATLAGMVPAGREGEPAGAEVAAQLAEIRQAAARAATLVDELRRHAVHGPLDLIPLDVADFVEQLLPFLSLVVPARVTVGLERGPGVPVVVADVDRLRELLVNLVANGAEAVGPEGGTVTVCTSVDGSVVVLEVVDDGEGIDPGDLGRIAEPLFTTRAGHVGIGLTVVEDTLLVFDGELTVESSTPGGTTMRVHLPLATTPVHVGGTAVEAVHDASPAARPADGDRPTAGVVLVVDDDESLRTLVRRVLTPIGVTVIEAGDGDGAIATVRSRGDIDLVILDVTMPGRDGVEVFETLQSEDPDLAVLVLTGYSAPETRARFPPASEVRIIHKPFDIHELRALVRSSLTASRPPDHPAR